MSAKIYDAKYTFVARRAQTAFDRPLNEHLKYMSTLDTKDQMLINQGLAALEVKTNRRRHRKGK